MGTPHGTSQYYNERCTNLWKVKNLSKPNILDTYIFVQTTQVKFAKISERCSDYTGESFKDFRYLHLHNLMFG